MDRGERGSDMVVSGGYIIGQTKARGGHLPSPRRECAQYRLGRQWL